MAEYTEKRSLKNVLVNRNFQFRYAISLAVICVAGTGYLYQFVTGRFSGLLDRVKIRQSMAPESLQAFEKIIQDLSMLTVLSGALTIAFAIGFALFVSHRIAGPASSIEKYIEDIKDGKLDETRALRAKDDLQPIMAALRDLARSLKRKSQK